MYHWRLRTFAALTGALILAACVLTPGKFTSTLTINKDRTFAYTYVGEVIALDMGKAMGDGMRSVSAGDADEAKPASTESKAEKRKAEEKKAEFDRKCRAIAAALMKEAGYRKAEYVGEGKFLIDYAIAGKLTHSFVYPFNPDADAILPFIAIEVRADGKVRMKAPGFAKDAGGAGPAGMGGAMGGSGPSERLDGTFTLDTDAEIVSQNTEAGATTVDGRKRVVWTVTPLNKTAPMAVIGF